jgi:hypothetical protein
MTADVAATIARESEQLTFVPRFIGHRSGLSEVKVDGWPPVGQTIFLSASADTVKKSLFVAFARALRTITDSASE